LILYVNHKIVFSIASYVFKLKTELYECFAKLLYSSFRRKPESRKYLIILDSGFRRNDIIAGFIQFCKVLYTNT
jgi:hypothetical protein